MRRPITDDEKKPRADATLKNLPDALMEELWQRCRRGTYKAAIVWLEEEHDIEIASTATLKEFYHWYPRQKYLRMAASVSDELAEASTKIPEIQATAKQSRALAQANFEMLAARNQDPELFAMLSAGEEKREKRILEREKFEWSKKTDIERALDALAEELGENEEARRHYQAMKAALAKGGQA
jgi:prophage DNA circulation protein